MQHEFKLTIFTPTYNRGYIIEKLYRSLQAQTVTAFEWLVVDDGSSDNTRQLFEAWMQEENPFPIRYYRQDTTTCKAPERPEKVETWNAVINRAYEELGMTAP